MPDYNLLHVQLNHVLEYVRPEIRMGLTSLFPEGMNISSDISSFSLPLILLFVYSSTIVTEIPCMVVHVLIALSG